MNYKQGLIDVCIINKDFTVFMEGILECLCNQTFKGFTVNICDFGSKDLPDTIIDKFRGILNIAYYKKQCHMQIARNFLADNTEGEYIVYMDADLLPSPTFLAEHLKALEFDIDEKYAYAFSDFEYKRPSGWVRQKMQDHIDRYGSTRPFPVYAPVPCWSLMRRKYFTRWDEDFNKLQDFELWCAIYHKHGKIGKLIPKSLARHIQNPNYSIGYKLIGEHKYWKKKLVEKYPKLFKESK